MGVSCIKRLIMGLEIEHAKTFAENCLQMLMFHMNYLLEGVFPHAVLQPRQFSFSVLKLVFNKFRALNK